MEFAVKRGKSDPGDGNETGRGNGDGGSSEADGERGRDLEYVLT